MKKKCICMIYLYTYIYICIHAYVNTHKYQHRSSVLYQCCLAPSCSSTTSKFFCMASSVAYIRTAETGTFFLKDPMFALNVSMFTQLIYVRCINIIRVMIVVDLSVFVQLSETSAPPSAFNGFEAGLKFGCSYDQHSVFSCATVAHIDGFVQLT